MNGENPDTKGPLPKLRSKAMSPGEIAKGQFITILDPIVGDETYPRGDAIYIGPREDHRSGWTGVPMEVIEVDLPFVLAKLQDERKFSLDLRLHLVMEMKKEFVDAFRDAPQQPGLPFGINVVALASAHNNLADVVAGHERSLRELAAKPAPVPLPPAKKPWWKRLLRL